MRELLVIGFEPFGESMYPHCYEVLQQLSQDFELTYTDCDDRGKEALRVGMTRPKFRINSLFRWPGWCRAYLRYTSWLKKSRKKIREKARDQEIILAMDHTALDLIDEDLLRNRSVYLWSLDFYSQDHFWRQDSFLIRRIVERNIRQCPHLKGIIVQDYRRSAVLDDILLSHGVAKFYLPVAVADFNDTDEEGLKNDLNKPINIGQIGSVNRQRGSDLLIEEVNALGENYRLIIKGHIDEEIRQSMDMSKVVIGDISPDLKQFRSFIRQIDIGVILCPLKNLNNTFFAMASGQMVEFFRLGIPVIAVGMEDMDNFLSVTNGGLGIESLAHLKAAIEQIQSEYEHYSRQARKAYERYFDLEIYIGDLRDFLKLTKS